MIHMSSKRALYEKKKMHGIARTSSKSTGMVELMGDTQLGPIKWKNFTHMKNNTTDFDHYSPHF